MSVTPCADMRFPFAFPMAFSGKRDKDWKPLPEEVAAMAAEILTCHRDPTHRPGPVSVNVASVVMDAVPDYAPQFTLPEEVAA